MNIRIFSFPVFSFQFNLNNTDGVDTISKTPITIISIDKIINTFISSPFFHNTFIFPAKPMLQNNKTRTKIPKSFFIIESYLNILGLCRMKLEDNLSIM